MMDPYLLDDTEVNTPIYGPAAPPNTKGGPGSGHFGHAGRPGAVGGSAPGGGSESATGPVPTSVALTRDLQALIGTDAVYVDNHPVAIDAGATTLSVLSEMKASGYSLPEHVSVIRQYGHPHGRVIWPHGKASSVLQISVPIAIPPDMDLDAAVVAGVGDTTTARTMRDVVIHEMGHHVHGRPEGKPSADFGSPSVRRAAQTVSEYATTNAAEFVAESFTRLYRGEALSPDAMELYRHLGGPAIKTARRSR